MDTDRVSTNWTMRDGYNPPYLLQDLTSWDYRFRYLSLGHPMPLIKYVAPLSFPAYNIIQGLIQEDGEINVVRPLTGAYIFVRVNFENGTGISNFPVCVMHGDTVDTIYTKASADDFFGNYFLTAPMPTYTLWVGDPDIGCGDDAAQDTRVGGANAVDTAMITGLGLGGELPNSEGDRTAFSFTFQYMLSAPAPVNDPLFRN